MKPIYCLFCNSAKEIVIKKKIGRVVEAQCERCGAVIKAVQEEKDEKQG